MSRTSLSNGKLIKMKSVLIVLGLVWLLLVLANTFGQTALIKAGLEITRNPTWVAALFILRVGIYTCMITWMRKNLRLRAFAPEEVRSATWALVRICVFYEFLLGLNVIGYLGSALASLSQPY